MRRSRGAQIYFPGGRKGAAGEGRDGQRLGTFTSLSLVLNTSCAPPCFLCSPASLIPLRPALFSVWPLCPHVVYFLSFFLFLAPLDFLQICPTETESEHLQALILKDVAGPKNARSKHMRAVFIINQLYGPLMEVISAKFMLGAFFFFFLPLPAVFSETAAR